ncbi:MAG: hypothetical protein AAF658_09955, partial [Myxococcota bacterium]
GTGGDDAAPDDLGYKFYAVRDDITCAQDTKRESQLDAANYEWVVGDGLATDFTTALADPTDEGEPGQRYWTDPVIANGAIVYFGSVFGDIETIDPCASLTGSDATRLYGIVARPFVTSTNERFSVGDAAPGFDGNTFVAAPVKLRTQIQVASASGPVVNQVSNATDQTLDRVFVQGLSQEDGGTTADVYTLNTQTPVQEIIPISTLRITRWREISLD